ncbi:MAG: DEAD/DEAH box helicase [Bacillota bacterium]|uniref:DEAD/DEAH box helicase n=1 Tax=Desulfurispora thermophila TaxID=265470 RepID=UPI00036C7573|nr:DEAD/DEAH box helicase [Desulfurispora thermophila]
MLRRKPKRRPKKQLAREAVFTGPLKLDPFQEQAIEALLAGRSVLVAAPTGTGKTLIAEKLLEKVIAGGKGAVYTSPIKALSNQKYRDFTALFGEERVGLITGDVSINEQGLLLVMTTEIFRNWCFANPYMLDNFTHVIFDEIHYLDDVERGTAWEESIIFAPAHIKILGLSATVPNVDEIAAWISQVRNEPVVVIEERRRAVPLKLHWITPEADVLKEREAREYIERHLELRRNRFWVEEDVFA